MKKKNSFVITAINQNKTSYVNLTIDRIFTKEEMMILEEERKRVAEEQLRIAEERKTKKDEDFKSQLQREISSIKNFDNSEYRESVDFISLEVVLFSVWANLVNKAKRSDNQEINNVCKELEQELKRLQIKEFPLMRKAYSEVVDDILWEQNVDVKIYGVYNNTLELIGGLFANNKNIKDVQAMIQEMLKLLRFDKINYKWYKYDNEYTYFNLESYKDEEIIEIK